MSKKVLIISTSLRPNANSEILARETERGALDAGCEVEFVTLKDKEIKLSSKELFNVEHTFTFEFNEGEFILNKGDYITIRAACNGSMDEDKMRYFNVEVSGRVVVE